MALDNTEDEVSALWEMAIADCKYRLCPHLASGRPGNCSHFRKYGAARCFICGYQDGLEDGYDYGYEDGRNEPNFDNEIAEEEERNAGMD